MNVWPCEVPPDAPLTAFEILAGAVAVLSPVAGLIAVSLVV